MALTGKRQPALGTCEHAATIPQHKVTSGYRLFRSDRPAWPMRLGRLAKPAIMGISCLMVLRVRNVQGTGGFAE